MLRSLIALPFSFLKLKTARMKVRKANMPVAAYHHFALSIPSPSNCAHQANGKQIRVMLVKVMSVAPALTGPGGPWSSVAPILSYIFDVYT